ncbi:conserved Plasmodium protein, unknown function [Plasmodium ovale wallikeri]|uniref:PIH1 domain-containing protein n=1 Tax=Plasmodium ovale wallikeri TaxID=864142 RepID=A0A1A8YSF0_PLAOA|nr:conserved Plasmodium protein, unknown function [Plasmodium ovale wallikeri]
MDIKSAENIWDALNDLHKNDKQAYERFMQKHMGRMQQVKPIKPKYCFCIGTEVEKVSIKTSTNVYKEKICDYFVYVYHTNKIRKPILPEDFINNIDSIKFENVFISTCKIKGECSKDMYAEAVIHTIIYKNMINVHFKNKVINRILEILYNSEKTIRSDIVININSFRYIDLGYIPKTCHYLNPNCTDNNSKEVQETSLDETDIKFYNILNEKQNKSRNKAEEEKDKIKIYDTSKNILNDIQSVKTTKRSIHTEAGKRSIPRQVQSYNYTIIDRFLHVVLTFSGISYADLEILKEGNNIDIYVSNRLDECMSLQFKENLSDNIKAYFNEKMLKLTLSVELQY